MKYTRLLFVLSLALAFQAVLYAQGAATIFGTATDPSMAVVPGVLVTITNAATAVARTTETNEVGSYVVSQLPIGIYSVRAEIGGFKTYVQDNIRVQVDENRRVDIGLTVGALTDSVTVAAQLAQVETREGTLREVVDSRRIVDLPLNGRNPLELQYLIAGSGGRAGQGQAQNESVSINGARTNSNNYTLDGGDNHDPYFNTPSIFPNPDALDEFSLQTNSYSADKGRNAGAIMNAVTKSGTNTFHGTLFEFVRNEKLNARSFFANDVPPFKRNQFGGTFGGPVSLPGLYSGNDRTFFFVTYQRTTQRSAPGAVSAVVLTEEQRRGDFSAFSKTLKDPLGGTFAGNIIPASRLYAPSLKFLDAFVPLPNRPNGSYTSASQETLDDDQFITKIDHNFGTSNRLFGRLLYNFNNRGEATGNLPGFLAAIEYTNWNLSLSDTHVFSATLVNTFTFSYNDIGRKQLSVVPGNNTWNDFGAKFTRTMTAAAPAAHDTNVDGYFRAFSRFPLNHFRQSWQFSNGLSWNRGRHFLKFGGDLRRSILDMQEFFRGDPYLRFRTTFTGEAAADFLLGRPTLINQIAETHNLPRTWEITFYTQDDWKVSQRLTLNMGLRYEPYLPFIDETDRFSQVHLGKQSQVFSSAPEGVLFPGDPGVPRSMVKSRWGNVSPRFGFAFDPTGSGKMSVRGGYGIFYAMIRQQAHNQISTNQPFSLKLNINNPPHGMDDPYSETGNPFPFQPPSTAEEIQAYPWLTPMAVTQWDPDFRNAVTQQWNLNIQRQFFESYIFTMAYVGSKGNHLFMAAELNPAIYGTTGSTDQRRRYYPTFASIVNQSSQGNSVYHALQLTLNKRLSKGVSVLSNYTWSKLLDNASNDGDGPSNPFDINNERGPSDFDISHRFVTSFIWELPRMRAFHPFVRHVLGGWEANGIVRLQSGGWITIGSGVDNSKSGVNGDRADLIGDPYLDTGRSRDQLINEYFNTAAFTVNAPGTFGNSGRNILHGPGDALVDFGLFKEFPIHENHRVLFRAEFFNFFNRVNLGNPNTNASNKNFGKITSSGAPRVVQFALKYLF